MTVAAFARPARAVLFDLDGVLLDTEPLYTEATQAVVGPLGKRFDWALKRELIGTSERSAAQMVIDRLELPLDVDEYLARRQPILDRLFARCPVMPGMPALVAELRSRGVALAVATSSVRDLYVVKSGCHDWFASFDAIVCGDDPRVRSVKPAPDIFLAAAASVGVPPAECVVVEDSPAGVRAGLAAGARVVAAPDPNVADDYVAGAHHIVRSPKALREVVLDLVRSP